MEQKQYKKQLVTKILVIAGLMVFTMFSALIVISVEKVKKSFDTTTKTNITQLSTVYTGMLGQWVEKSINYLDLYTKSEVVFDGKSPSEIGKWLTSTVDRRPNSFEYVLFIDKDGNSFYDDGKTGNHSDREYYKLISSGQATSFVSDPITSKATHKISLMIVKAAIDRTGDLKGMFVGVQSLDFVQNVISSLQIGREGYAFVLDGSGNVVAHKRADSINSSNYLFGRNLDPDLLTVAKGMVEQKTGIGRAYVRSKEEVVISYGPIEKTQMSLAICYPMVEQKEAPNDLMKFLFTGNLIAEIVVITILLILLKSSISPLHTVVDIIDGIATGNADLTQRIQINHDNEIGAVVNGFNMFIQKIQDIIVKVKASKDNLNSIDSDLAAAIEDTESSITQILANIESVKNHIIKEHASVQGTASAMTQITSNVQSLEKMIENQASGVTQASAAIEQMIGNIGSVNNSVEKMANSFDELQNNATVGSEKQSVVNERIMQIENQSAMLQEANAAISAIAEQTNLLAMNAAIEAAHAGDAGKGFSVVADEIRKLAETASTQSRTIGEQLTKIKESIGEVVSSSEESSNAFASVSTNIETTDELVRQIRAAMQEQQDGSRQVLEALQMMSNTTQEVRAAAVEMSNGSESILQEVSTLKDYTDEMEISMEEMNTGATKINETGSALHDISSNMRTAIYVIGSEIDQFKV